MTPTEPLATQLALVGTVCVALNASADVITVLAADRLLRSDAVRNTRARWITRASGITMIGLGGWLALARRDAGLQ